MSKKFLQATSKANSINENDYTIDFIMTKEIVDRHGDIVDVDTIDMKYFELNPVVQPSHDHSALTVAKVVSAWVEVVDGIKQLVAKVKFAAEEYDLAMTYWKLYKGEYMRAVSIGFIPKRFEQEQTGATRLLDCEILELSLVAIPANQLALAKSAGLDIKSVAVAERNTVLKDIRSQMIAFKELIAETGEDIDDGGEEDQPNEETPKEVTTETTHEPETVEEKKIDYNAIAMSAMAKAIRYIAK